MASVTDNKLVGCDFDSATAKALNGNDIVALVTDSTGANLLAVAGQQGLSFNLNQDTTEAATKDDAIGGSKRPAAGSCASPATRTGTRPSTASTRPTTRPRRWSPRRLPTAPTFA